MSIVHLHDHAHGGPGISGDGNSTREFLDHGAYGYGDAITAPTTGATLEAWIKPDDSGGMALVSSGDAAELDIRGGDFSFRRAGHHHVPPRRASPASGRPWSARGMA